MSGVTPALFAEALLARVGLPTSDNNILALVAFQRWEGGHMANDANFNPMNTTWVSPGSGLMSGPNPAKVRSYLNWEQGLDATARTLTNGAYKGIVAALARSAPPDETLREVAKSPWGCTICANAPAASAAYYADKIFPDRGGGGLGFLRSKWSMLGIAAALGVVGVILVVAGSKRR
jgi:hypothetical protein